MGLILKERLKKLCCSNGWSYGVFWHFDQRNSMLLTVKDSYFEEKMGALVNNMLLQVQTLGEGIVGEAALTGKKQWIFSDANNGGRSSMPQDDSEILWQFSSGLKTVAVIPVDSRGVLQFGSTNKILESSEFIGQTKRLFNELEDMNGISSVDDPSSCDLNEWFASSCNGNITPIYGGSCNELMEIAYTSTDLTQSAFASDFQQEKVEPLCSDSTHLNPNPRFHQLISQSALSVESLASEIPCISTWSNEDSILTSLESIGELVHEEYKLDDFDTKQANSFAADNLFEWFASTPESCIQKFTPIMNEYVSSSAGANSLSTSLIGDVSLESQFAQSASSVRSSIKDAYARGKQQKSANYMHVKDAGNDLFKGFGVEYGCGKAADRYENLKPANLGRLAMVSGVSECISELDVNSVNGTKKGLFSELGLEELLNGSTNSSINDRFSNAKRRRLESSSTSQSMKGSISCSGGSSTTMQPAYHKDNETIFVSNKDVFPESQVGLWIDDSYSINNVPSVLAKTKKHEEPTKATKKRAKPGESARPRPKDRQQIQDRMQELKEIIPDGGKCSIDTLLDRTIKYMLFLQSVTKYADKIKQIDEPKLIGEENKKIPQENISGRGATWAVEVGDKSMACPIIVEDLTPPGLMLIEMLCGDRGFFLEIADVIRGFGLNVLKGEMETREDKIWARFIVEAKTNITRIDVFWSLVQLLQLTSTTGIDSKNHRPSNGMNSWPDPHLNNFKQPPLPCSISVAETLQ